MSAGQVIVGLIFFAVVAEGLIQINRIMDREYALQSGDCVNSDSREINGKRLVQYLCRDENDFPTSIWVEAPNREAK